MILDETELQQICAHVNASLDVPAYLEFLGYRPERALKLKGMWRSFCPVHRDPLFRTLVINPRRNTCQCEYTGCQAHQPGDLIELLANARNVDKLRSVQMLVENFGPEALKISRDQAEALAKASAVTTIEGASVEADDSCRAAG